LDWEYQPVYFEEFTPRRAGGVIKAKTIYSFAVYWTSVPFGYNGNRGSAQVFLLLRAPWKSLLKNFAALDDELLKRRMIHDFASILPRPGIIVDTKYVIRYWPDAGTCGMRVGLDSPQEHNNNWLQLLSEAARISTVDEDQQEVVVDQPGTGECFGFASMIDQTPPFRRVPLPSKRPCASRWNATKSMPRNN
jgi:hypothetical protein